MRAHPSLPYIVEGGNVQEVRAEHLPWQPVVPEIINSQETFQRKPLQPPERGAWCAAACMRRDGHCDRNCGRTWTCVVRRRRLRQ